MIKLKQILKEAIDPLLDQKAKDLRQKLLQQYGNHIEDLYFHIPTNRPDVLQLDNIRLWKSSRGQGIGSAILDALKQFADENQLVIVLSPEPDPRCQAKLDCFYHSHGLVHNRGRKKDYRYSSFDGPTMIRRPIREEEVDEYELESLEGKEAILQYLQAHNKTPQVIDLGGNEYITWDDNIVDPEFPDVKKKSDWMYSMEAMRLVSVLKGMMEDRFNQRFWEHPELLFHATSRENADGIRQEGLRAKHISRGFANRHIRSAVFTSTEPDWITHSYGPVVITIRTDMMKKDGFMPYATKEPNHTEAEVMDFIAGKIGAWEPGTHDLSNSRNEGTTEDTVILYGSIPPKYLEITD